MIFVLELDITMEFHDGTLRRFVKFWLAATIASLLLFVLVTRGWSPVDMRALSRRQATIIPAARNSDKDAQSSFPGLAKLLARVSTDDRTVIITSVNEAFARPGSLLDLFRESFYAGEKISHLLDHLLVVAVDRTAYHHCRRVHPFCYLLKANTSMNLSSANNYMSDAYVELVWAKLELQQRVLQLGYNLLFTDVDIVWFRDPFRHIGVHADMAASSDLYFGDPDDVDHNWPNTGFYYVKSTDRTVEMLRRWRAARWRFPRGHEQAIFNNIKHELAAADGELRVRFQFLDTAQFGGFCQLFRNDMAKACTMHANCCVGLGNKLHDLRDVLGQWKNYTVMTPAERNKAKAAGRSFERRVPAKCGTPDKKAPAGGPDRGKRATN